MFGSREQYRQKGLGRKGFEDEVFGEEGEVMPGADRVWLDRDKKQYLDIKEKERGVFIVVGENLTDYSTSLVFSSWDDVVEDLDDNGSTGPQFFGMSDHVRFEDVDMEVVWDKDEQGNYEQFLRIEAPSLDRVKEALKHVIVDSWDWREM